MSVQDEKQRLRTEMRARRIAQAPHALEAPASMSANFLSRFTFPAPKIIGAYDAFQSEMPLDTLMKALKGLGHKVALPRIIGKKQPLDFKLFQDPAELVVTKMGVREPHGDQPSIDPDVLLVPLLAFDRNCRRLGYGGGYYDRSIVTLRARKPILAIGIAYTFQEVASVPVGAYDEELDAVVTDVNVF